VLITGSGPIGLLTLVACLQANPRVVVTADLVPKRRAAAIALGADAALDPTEEGWREKLAEVVGKEEVDVSVDAVGTPAAFQQAVSLVGPGGTVIAIGGWCDVPLDLDRLMHLEIHVKGSFGFTPVEFEEGLLWLEESRFDADQVITDVLPLAEEGATVFVELTQHRRPESIKVVLIPPEVKE
jgi:threonine dehydrogenase-like Zn-dependent dehydrogenase